MWTSVLSPQPIDLSHAPSAPLPFFHSPYIPSIFYSPTLHPFIQAIAFTYTSISYYFLYPSILALSLLPLFSSFSRPLLCLSGFWIFSTCYGMGVTICLFPLSLILIRKSSQNFSHLPPTQHVLFLFLPTYPSIRTIGCRSTFPSSTLLCDTIRYDRDTIRYIYDMQPHYNIIL